MTEMPILLTVVSLKRDTTAQYMLYQDSTYVESTIVDTSRCPPANRYQIDLSVDSIESIENKLHLLKLIGGQ
jgi:hypothetical protein